MRAWRITRRRYAEIAFSGDGAALHPGRWNDFELPMVYCADSLALAVLELLVNVEPEQPQSDLVYFSADIPDRVVKTLGPRELPPDWRAYPRPDSVKLMGVRWLQSSASLALVVPSVVVPSESVVLINPLHPQAVQLRISDPEPFSLDSRLLDRRA